jgi:hypothetical protein
MVLLGRRAVEEEEEVERQVEVEVVVGVEEEARGRQPSSSSYETPSISPSLLRATQPLICSHTRALVTGFPLQMLMW